MMYPNLLKDIKYRVQPYWSLLMACELANPVSPKHVSPMAWDGVRDLMKRTGKFTQVEIDATVKNLSDQRKYYSRTSAAAEHRMSENLLKFYHDRFQSSNREHQFALCDEFYCADCIDSHACVEGERVIPYKLDCTDCVDSPTICTACGTHGVC